MSNTHIPGDPGGLHALAAQLGSAGDNIGSIGARVAANGLPGWVGIGGDAFRASQQRFPGEMDGVSRALMDASGHISAFASQLEGFQFTAARLAEQIAENAAAQSAARARHAAAQLAVNRANLAHSLAHDPVSLHTARVLLSGAQNGLRLAGNVVMAGVEEGGALAARAAENFAAYERAVQACIAGLGAAVPGIAAFLGGAFARVESLTAHTDALVLTAFRGGASFASDHTREEEELLLGLLGGGLALGVGIPLVAALAGGGGRTGLRSAVAFFERDGMNIINDVGTVQNVEDIPRDIFRTKAAWDLEHLRPGEFGSIDGDWQRLEGFKVFDQNPGVKVFSGAAAGLAYVGDVVQARGDAYAVPGESGAGRAVTFTLSAGGQGAVDRFWPATLVNFAEGNTLKADVSAVAMIAGGAVSGGPAGALKADNVWATQMAKGNFGKPMQYFAQGENWVIDKAYGPVSNVTHAVSSTIGSGYQGAKHLVSRGLQAIGL